MGKRKRKPPRTLPGTEVLRILGRIGATIHKPNKSSHAKVIVSYRCKATRFWWR